MRTVFAGALAILLAVFLLSFSGCARKTRVVHCDRCGAEIKVEEDSNVTEDWTLFCEDCAKEVEPDLEKIF